MQSPVTPLLLADSRAAAGDDTRANINGGASSPDASDVLFATSVRGGDRLETRRNGVPMR